MNKLFLIGLIGLANCSTTTVVPSEDIDSGVAGAAGSDFDGGAGAAGAAAGAGGSSGSSGASGSAGASAGGSAGTSGSGGSGGGQCIPKTCLTIAVDLAGGQVDPVPDACGLVDDGCGNMIDCGGCENAEQGCGAGEPEFYTRVRVNIVNQIENLCQGECVEYNDSATETFCDDFIGTKLFLCLPTFTEPPSCTEIGGGLFCCSY